MLSEEQKEFLKRAKDEGFEIVFNQSNPKLQGSISWERYEKYKHARNLKEILQLGGLKKI